jgi:hypothetical protein
MTDERGKKLGGKQKQPANVLHLSAPDLDPVADAERSRPNEEKAGHKVG